MNLEDSSQSGTILMEVLLSIVLSLLLANLSTAALHTSMRQAQQWIQRIALLDQLQQQLPESLEDEAKLLANFALITLCRENDHWRIRWQTQDQSQLSCSANATGMQWRLPRIQTRHWAIDAKRF